MTVTQERLPTRHPHLVVRFRYNSVDYVATIARFGDGRPAEIFLTASVKYGSELQHLLDVQAILVSVALQHGVPLDTIRRSLKVGAMYQALSFFDGGPIKVVQS